MLSIIKLPFIAGLFFLLSPEDPCTHKAQESVLGQAGSQLLDALALNDVQKNKIFDIQAQLFEATQTPNQNVELARQKIFDSFLIAVEDGIIDSDEITHLNTLQKNQRQARQKVIDAYKQATINIQATFSEKQKVVLDSFVPEIVMWDEALNEAKRLLNAYRRFKQSYVSGNKAMLNDFHKFMAFLEETRPLVYIPPWMDLQLEAIANDLSMYRKDFEGALQHIAPIKEEDLTEADLVLDHSVALLARAVEMARRPGSNEEEPDTSRFPFLSDFHKKVLVTPLFHCLLAES